MNLTRRAFDDLLTSLAVTTCEWTEQTWEIYCQLESALPERTKAVALAVFTAGQLRHQDPLTIEYLREYLQTLQRDGFVQFKQPKEEEMQ